MGCMSNARNAFREEFSGQDKAVASCLRFTTLSEPNYSAFKAEVLMEIARRNYRITGTMVHRYLGLVRLLVEERW